MIIAYMVMNVLFTLLAGLVQVRGSAAAARAHPSVCRCSACGYVCGAVRGDGAAALLPLVDILMRKSSRDRSLRAALRCASPGRGVTWLVAPDVCGGVRGACVVWVRRPRVRMCAHYLG